MKNILGIDVKRKEDFFLIDFKTNFKKEETPLR